MHKTVYLPKGLKATDGASPRPRLPLFTSPASDLAERMDEALGGSSLDRAGKSVGRFPGGPRDRSTNGRHLDGFGR
jgi:hypothetical protein